LYAAQRISSGAAILRRQLFFWTRAETKAITQAGKGGVVMPLTGEEAKQRLNGMAQRGEKVYEENLRSLLEPTCNG
jgi:hypothetical protein